MKLKKIPLYLLIALLTLGTAVMLGFLSFTGLMAIVPIVGLGVGAFVLSTVYDAEIFFQNIREALGKLFKTNYIRMSCAKQFLLDNFPNDTQADDCPAFFDDYIKQLRYLQFLKENSKKDSSLKKDLKKAKKDLKKMDKFFAYQCFRKEKSDNSTLTPYEASLLAWLENHGKNKFIQSYHKRRLLFHGFKGFSFIAGVFMGLGTSYLLSEAIAAIPLISALLASSVTGLPVLIGLGVLVVAGGIAWGLLTYNTLTDIIEHRVIQKWLATIKKSWSEGFTLKNVFRVLGILVMLTMATLLTIATAGTWWTIAKEGKPLFNFIGKIPGCIMRIVNPIVIGISEGSFNLSNSYKTFRELSHTKFSAFKLNLENESLGQLFNPFRILIKMTVTPLKLILFMGHLLSMAVTADRLPGIPAIVTALFGFIAEGFEDFNYFNPWHADHDQHAAPPSDKALLKAHLDPDNDHDHGNDIPSRLIKIVFSPLYLLASIWEWATGPKNFKESCVKQGLFLCDYFPSWFKSSPPAKAYQTQGYDVLNQPSNAWEVAKTRRRIEEYNHTHFKGCFFGGRKATEKSDALKQFHDDLKQNPQVDLYNRTTQESKEPCYRRHRFLGHGATKTEKFLISIANEYVRPESQNR